jgi:tRNA1(Val) A37 N6-methylase TrmN6
MFADENLSDDRFLGGQLRLLQPKLGYRAATDPVFLAAAAPVAAGDCVLELGCGAGTASLCVARRITGAEVTGIEVQPGYADLARRNAARNGLTLEVVEGDVSAMPEGLRARSFDHVICNPPFYFAQSATAAADSGRDIAHREGGADLRVFLDQGLRRLRPGGWLTVIHRTERLGGLVSGLEGRAGDIHVLPLAARVGRPAKRILVTARKGARAPLKLLAPLIVHTGAVHRSDSADYTPEAEAILRDGRAINLYV